MVSRTLGRRSHSLYSALQTLIESGQLTEDTRLPSERDLCEQYGVSRPTVRKALLQLKANGLVDIVANSGAFVRAASVRRPHSETISIMTIFDGNELRSVQNFLLSKGYLLCIFSQLEEDWSLAAERQFLEKVIESRHKGVICFCTPTEPYNEEILRRAASEGIRVVHTEYYRGEVPGQEYLIPDYALAGYMATTSLMLAGYRGIYYTGLLHERRTFQLVEEGVKSALKDYRNEDYEPHLARLSSKEIPDEETLRIFKETVENSQRSSGFIVRSERQAHAFLAAAKQFKFKIPEEVGIINAGPVYGNLAEALVDTVACDPLEILTKAVERVISTDDSLLQKLERPTMLRRGTVREAILH
ncbi:MAG: GntR family transcriptional regulator [Terrimicrobiaceae bacterium]